MSDYFNSSKLYGCPHTNCSVGLGKCNETQGDASDLLNFNSSSYNLTLNTNVTEGYNETFCFICSNLNQTENVTIIANQTTDFCGITEAIPFEMRLMDNQLRENEIMITNLTGLFSENRHCPALECALYEQDCLTNSSIAWMDNSTNELWAFTDLLDTTITNFCVECIFGDLIV